MDTKYYAGNILSKTLLKMNFGKSGFNYKLGNYTVINKAINENDWESINIITDKNGSLQTNRDNIAKILNENFHSVFVIEDPTNFPNITVKTSKILELDIDSVITQDIVRIKLSELNVNKALGADGVSSYVLKICQNSFCKPLELLFKRSLKEEQIPLIWKMANVTPLYKNGDKNDPANYRPISLTSIPSKILESILGDKIMDYMLTNNLLNSNQHGFRKNKSCTTNLLETQDILFDAIENGWCVDMLYTDFSKAFDKVPHIGLMLKLKLYDMDIRINKLQLEIDNIMKWSSLWLMKFKYEKCKIMHIGFKNPCITYSMFDAETQQNNILAISKLERDLGATMQSNLKWTNHIDKAVGKSNQMLALIKRTF
ncbi:uncharacterized protein LOC136080171 [Hydra vulgaris]|uniref:Uncharacterized protein LOC136080171 n=1 Tax=Hydra vulgaris TaxID=6087 RepID=A0ABM4BUJ5_HYDVU